MDNRGGKKMVEKIRFRSQEKQTKTYRGEVQPTAVKLKEQVERVVKQKNEISLRKLVLQLNISLGLI